MRLSFPSARKNASTDAAPSVAHVSSRARSAPLQYGPEVSASQKICLSKLATTVAPNLLHVGDRNLMLRRDLLHRPVLLQRLDRAAQRRSQLLVRRAVVD